MGLSQSNQSNQSNQSTGGGSTNTTGGLYGTLPTIETVFFILDIYNDAADVVLRSVRRQHLFDEIESEASLAVEHLVITLP